MSVGSMKTAIRPHPSSALFSTPLVLNWRWFCAPLSGIFGSVCRYFWSSQLRGRGVGSDFEEWTRECFQARELAPNQFLHNIQVTEGLPRDPKRPTRLALTSHTWRDVPYLRIREGGSGAGCHSPGLFWTTSTPPRIHWQETAVT